MVKPFTPDEPQFDQSTLMGRVRHFSTLTNPQNLFVTSAELDHSRKIISEFRQGARTASDAELWKAKTRLTANVHPDTNEITPLPLRLSAFVPMNVPIAAGMLLSAPTVFNSILWQWVNQSYNAAFNYANRNASSETSTEELMKAYGAACAVSCGTAVSLNEALKRATPRLSANALFALGKIIPYSAVVSASIFNVYLMRRQETIKVGVLQLDLNVTRASKSLMRTVVCWELHEKQTALTRAVLPIPVILFPGYVIGACERTSFMKARPRLRVPMQLGVITSFLMGALPVAVGLFPQEASIAATKLEPEFHNLADNEGKPIRTVFFNKGV